MPDFGHRRVKVAVVVLALVGLGLRLWMITGRIGVFDSDDAVPGLMALTIPEELPVFFWGQAYGGSIESFVAAALFLALPDTWFVLKLVPLAFGAGSALLCWRIGIRLIGPKGGVLAGALFWLPSIGLLHWSTKVGPYLAGLFFTLLALLMLLQATEAGDWSEAEAGALGLIAGVAWWSNPQSVYLLAPAALVLLRGLLRHWRRYPLIVVGFVAGAAPWLVYNVRHDWRSLHLPGQATTGPNGYVDHLHGFFTVALPMALGLREPFTTDWVAPGAMALYVVALGALAWIAVDAVRRRSPLLPLVAIAGAYPFLYALSPFSWYVATPKYMLFLLPVLCLLVASVLGRQSRSSLIALGVALVVAVVGTVGIVRVNTAPGAPDALVPTRLDGVGALLEANGVRHAFANYWVAYRVTFELSERVQLTAIDYPRATAIDRAVRADPRPAYLFVDGSSWLARFRDALVRLSVPAETHQRGPWVLIVPGRKLLPEEAPEVWTVEF